jgi:hypothetical protein
MDRKRLAQSVLHAEERNATEWRTRVGVLVPRWTFQILALLACELADFGAKFGIGAKRFDSLARSRLQNQPGIMSERPKLWVDPAPD